MLVGTAEAKRFSGDSQGESSESSKPRPTQVGAVIINILTSLINNTDSVRGRGRTLKHRLAVTALKITLSE